MRYDAILFARQTIPATKLYHLPKRTAWCTSAIDNAAPVACSTETVACFSRCSLSSRARQNDTSESISWRHEFVAVGRRSVPRSGCVNQMIFTVKRQITTNNSVGASAALKTSMQSMRTRGIRFYAWLIVRTLVEVVLVLYWIINL